MTTAGTAWVWFGSQKWVYDTLESVQKKEVMKVLSHTFLERAFCPHSYRWKPHLLRETNFPVQRDFNSQITTIPLNLHYMWPDGRGENNSKVRHEAIYNSLISNASKAYQWNVLWDRLWSFSNYVWLTACQRHTQNPITSRESLTIHSAFLFWRGGAVLTHRLRRAFFLAQKQLISNSFKAFPRCVTQTMLKYFIGHLWFKLKTAHEWNFSTERH